MRLNILHFTALVGLANAGNYMFDESCNATPGMLDFVRQTFTNALAMSQAAYDATVQTPLNQGVQAALASLVNPSTPVQSTPAQFAAQIFGPQGINRLNSEVTDNLLLGSNDVKVYCDQTRIKQRKEDSKWIDTDVNREDVQRLKCLARYAATESAMFALMYTTFNPVRRDGQGNQIAGESFQQIQICPFFLLWALPLQTNLNTLLLPKILWKKMTIGLAQKLLTATRFTPIDAVSLFDKVMLHELTHATTSNVMTDDIDVNGGPAYGWKLCTQLSTSNSVGAGAAQNADTWALYASICWQLQQGLITGVNADGTINKA